MEWKICESCPTYEIADSGELRHVKTKKLKKATPNIGGYPQYKVYIDGKRMHKRAHRLVAEAFVPNPEGKPHVNHIDSDRANPHASNLEWCTMKENTQHALAVGRFDDMPKGEGHGMSKLTEDQAKMILSLRGTETLRATAARFNVSVSTVWQIQKGWNWKHLEEKSEESVQGYCKARQDHFNQNYPRYKPKHPPKPPENA